MISSPYELNRILHVEANVKSLQLNSIPLKCLLHYQLPNLETHPVLGQHFLVFIPTILPRSDLNPFPSWH